jgi:ABC-type sulfate transport system permease subunit
MAFSKLNSIGYYAFKLASPDRTDNEYNFVAAFAVASLLALLALVTLLVKALVEWQAKSSGEPLH